MTAPRGAYETRLSPETWAYIDAVARWFPPSLAGRPWPEQRQVYNAMCRHFHLGRPAAVRVDDRRCAGLRVRDYARDGQAEGVVLLFFHGGGFVLGDLDSHDDICAELCDRARVAVVSVDYRLAPEHPHPAAFEDALAVFDALAGFDAPAPGRRIVLAGESAGGTLAAAVAQARRGSPALGGLMLICPGLGSRATDGSRAKHAEAPMLSTRDMDLYAALRSGGVPPLDDPAFAPLSEPDLSGMPPTRIVTAECDPLSDEGALYARRIRDAGGRADCTEMARLTHSFLRSRGTVPEAAAAMTVIAGDVAALVAGAVRRG